MYEHQNLLFLHLIIYQLKYSLNINLYELYFMIVDIKQLI
jgi:hypothetical protein